MAVLVGQKTKPSHDHRLSWLRPTLVPALVALVVLVIGGVFLDKQNSVLNQERARAGVVAEVSLIRAKLEGNINGNFQLVRGLISTLSTQPDMDQRHFSALVANLFKEHSQLRLIAAAPDLKVSMIYPLAGNEKAIGLDYRTNTAQRPSVLRARDSGRLVLAGPVELVQGGRGFIGRFPVYTETLYGRHFWGVVSAVVDVGRLYADSGLLDSGLGVDISISSQDTVGLPATRFFGPDLEAQSPVRSSITLPSGTWEIAATPKGGWESAPSNTLLLRLAMVIAGALILLPIAITGRLLGERQSHFRELKSREAELEQISRRLELALDVSKIGVWEMDLSTGDETWDARTNELYGLDPNGGARSHDHWKAAVHPEDQQRAEADFRRMIATGRYESKYRVQLSDNSIRHIRSMGALFNEPGEPERVVGVNWDVTADVLLNEELRHATLLTEARNRELEAARVRIEHNSLHDSLTGLPNRRYLDDMLKQQAAGGYHGSGSMAMLHVDLDRFKQINDTLGHAAGDAMLIHASAVLRDNCSYNDFVARIGGDEFVVLTSAEDGDFYLGALAERIVRQMRQPVKYEGHECRFGVSIGIAADRGETLDVQRLLINADIALYRAKGRGRNRYEFFSEALQAEVVTTKRVADEILNGLERDEFVAWFQPQFDAHTLEVVGVEALARWQHPIDGIKPPAAFLPIAEELNVVATIDRIVLARALEALDRWDELGLNVPRASVNVSHRRLHDEDLIKGLLELDIEPGRISFELVESIYLDEGDAVIGWNIDQIKELGIDVEIDDFGTGYASIVSLQKLRPKRLKIDRQLVEPIIVDLGQRQLLASIVEIGKAMGIEVIAEGVETMEHAAILRDLGVDILQGFAFSRPLSAQDLETFLTTRAWIKAS
ncbi:periplasmic sensor diguanylate cyclase/phosphodiesterase [Devosia sp. YR412]|uniref:bifunctional diguanylate cyclase/phosphodiesterase n=1 Tax=Devosia sp. YR412 TaxID=1881030 RepID=UPI0008C6B96E|nr:EAL domain-containing protein [Devosia sp. YR412]SEP66265.1 periplasmic sensor diguanylate cyclase/phosphodiesterase [Devosia sp. YR412]